jgi:5-methylthioadenosine/S-adenosylhomocysteine deaminase
MATILRGGTVVTMNDHREVFKGDLRIDGNEITDLGPKVKAYAGDDEFDVTGHIVIPGFVQAHTHLCQALFRGFADDLSLLDWLTERIWPMESGHNPESIEASARIGLLEMQMLGTTTILDMGTVRYTERIFEVAEESGMRYVGGKCLMDHKASSGPLYEPTAMALAETEELIKRWAGRSALIEYAICPRFAISCTDKLLKACAKLQAKYGVLIHTHASENLEEVATVKKRTGLNNIDYLSFVGLLNSRTVIAHGIHLSPGELKKMVESETGLAHCPSSNLKLASGIAAIEKYRHAGLKIGLGSDGAPCNNMMDPFMEMRLAALLQKPRFGPEAMPAESALFMATRGGAQVLNKEGIIGSLEKGKLADIVVVDTSHPSVATVENPYSALVYSCSGRDVKHVIINGNFVVKNRQHWKWQPRDVIGSAVRERQALFKRVGIT